MTELSVKHLEKMLTVMVSAGALGGHVNWLLLLSKDWLALYTEAVIGIAAALMAPLFLPRDLLLLSKDDPISLLKFGGYCLIFSIAARSVINNLNMLRVF